MTCSPPLWWPNKDPDDKLKLGIDWAASLLNGDTIATSTWTLVDDAGGVLLTLDTKDDTATWVIVDKGLHGRTLRVLNRITTSSGEKFDQTVNQLIRNR